MFLARPESALLQTFPDHLTRRQPTVAWRLLRDGCPQRSVSMVADQQGNAVADELATDPVTRRAPIVRANPMMYNTPMRSDPHVRRPPSSAGLYDVLDLILDKGIVIDAFVRVSLVGIELVTIDLRVVIASVDTYLRYAEGAERLQLNDRSESKSVPEMVDDTQEGMVGKGLKKAKEMFTGSDDDSGEEKEKDEHKGATGLVGGVRSAVRKILRGHDEDEDEGNGH